MKENKASVNLIATADIQDLYHDLAELIKHASRISIYNFENIINKDTRNSYSDAHPFLYYATLIIEQLQKKNALPDEDTMKALQINLYSETGLQTDDAPRNAVFYQQFLTWLAGINTYEKLKTQLPNANNKNIIAQYATQNHVNFTVISREKSYSNKTVQEIISVDNRGELNILTPVVSDEVLASRSADNSFSESKKLDNMSDKKSVESEDLINDFYLIPSTEKIISNEENVIETSKKNLASELKQLQDFLNLTFFSEEKRTVRDKEIKKLNTLINDFFDKKEFCSAQAVLQFRKKRESLIENLKNLFIDEPSNNLLYIARFERALMSVTQPDSIAKFKQTIDIPEKVETYHQKLIKTIEILKKSIKEYYTENHDEKARLIQELEEKTEDFFAQRKFYDKMACQKLTEELSSIMQSHKSILKKDSRQTLLSQKKFNFKTTMQILFFGNRQKPIALVKETIKIAKKMSRKIG